MTTKLTYAYLMLLLLVGAQLATSKSVDERTLALKKRQATTEQSVAETESTTPLSEEEGEENSEATTIQETTTTPSPPPRKRTSKPSKPRRQSVKASTTPAPTTPAEEEEEAVEEGEEEEEVSTAAAVEEAPTVKPLATDKVRPKKPKKPSASNTPSVQTRIGGDGEEETTPSTDLLPPNMPINPSPQGYFPPDQDPGFNPWRLNPMPAPPSVSGPYDYPHPSGPAFSETRVEGPATGAGTGPGSSAFAGGFASASASAGGSGGMVSTSISGGTGPGGVAHQSSSSFSSSGGPFPARAAAQAPFPNVNSRGSFPEDSDSVGIEVNGPEFRPSAAAGVPGGPIYTAGPNYGSISGPGYSAQAGFGAPNQYPNYIPSYGPSFYGPNVFDIQNYLRQYFANLEAQHLAFQRQIQAQQQAGGTFASGGATITNTQGATDPNAQVYVNTRSSANSASASTSVDSRSGFGGSKSTVVAYPTPPNNNDNSNRIWDQNRVDSNFGPQGGFPGGIPGAGLYGGPGFSSSGPVSAFASGSIGPQGGYQSAQISPAAPDIFSRFGEEIPPPSGNNYGVFSSSSSSSSVGPDGKQTSKKTATVAVNDNGKISVKTVHDP